ncbi:MAG: MarR family transcriptional regulator [Oscillibacter sp.]|jgi:DNA-binding MarR family transcriptional regulator|uniref:MarR family winged helix-turn-helix transcriptional regulator n=1 Tax=uncultured Oscillibacter sp. TaxID=876091 RepID=UPI002173B619|nr:MarR family transcriptional regulator [uncultured Oscillibacter sp.]MCI9644988.1 MarR family transcriptional regulator [Oscillibacter sp.]
MITIAQLTRLPRRFLKYYDQQFLPLLEKTGLSMREVHVLLFLANHPGQDTARDVTELRGLAKSQVSQAVEVLTDRGLLARRADGEDRRIIHLEITGEGAPLAREAQAVQAACGRRLLAGLAEEEQAVFLGLLERVLREMEELGAEKERWT